MYLLRACHGVVVGRPGFRTAVGVLLAAALLVLPGQAADAAPRSRMPMPGMPDPAPRLAVGQYHVCHVVIDGTVACWGANDRGQLGQSSGTESRVPVTVPALSRVVAVTAGSHHSCALTSAGRLYCWGDNAYGQLGLGTKSAPQATPQEVKGLADVPVAVAAGGTHTCALLVNATVSCWGRNGLGQVSQADTAEIPAPTPVAGVTNAIAVASGEQFSCALIVGGSVRCWGDNRYGQLGVGNTQALRWTATVGNLTDAVQIALGRGHACALRAGTSVVCWGANDRGQAGRAGSTQWTSPVVVSAAGEGPGFIHVAAGLEHSCAVRVDGSVACWGSDVFEQLGNGTSAGSMVGGLAGTATLAAGGYSSCSLQTTGAVLCWGDNARGQLGNGGIAAQSLPAPVAGLVVANRVLGAMAGGGGPAPGSAGLYGHSCALRGDGQLLCWGTSHRGEAGSPTTQGPRQVGAPGARSLVSGGANHNCFIRGDGKLYCFGDNGGGQLGNGSRGGWSAGPVTGGNYLTNVSTAALGDLFSCAAVSGGVGCWGYNDNGQVGLAEQGFYLQAQRIQGLGGVIGLSTTSDMGCALRVDGTIWCWGSGPASGSWYNSHVPAQIAGINTAIAIDSGAAFSCALLAEGSVRCWGSNDRGQLGDGTTQERSSAVLVAGVDRAIAISAGNSHACALRANGAVVCWGDNTSGQLGDNTFVNRSLAVPVQQVVMQATAMTPQVMQALGGRATVHVAGQHSCSVDGNGTMRCWGRNTEGQLGVAGAGPYATAVAVPFFQ